MHIDYSKFPKISQKFLKIPKFSKTLSNPELNFSGCYIVLVMCVLFFSSDWYNDESFGSFASLGVILVLSVGLIWFELEKKGSFHFSVTFGIVWAVNKILKLFGIGLGFCLPYIKAEWIFGKGRESWVIWGFNSSWFNVCKVKLFRLAVDMLMIELLSLF